MSKLDPSIKVEGFVDDDISIQGCSFLGLPVLGPISSLSNYSHDSVVIAIGDNRIRRALRKRLLSSGETFASAIHPSVVLGTDVRIGQGVMVCAGVIVHTGSVIEDHVILNTACTVDHHCNIGAFSHVAPGVHLGGEVTVGEGVLLGIGSVVLPCCEIGAWAVVGGGAVVTTDQSPGVTVVGVPARVITSSPSKETFEVLMNRGHNSGSGGATMMANGSSFLPIIRPTLPPWSDISKLVQSSWETGTVTLGPLVRTLEDEVCRQTGVRHAVAVSS